MVEIKVTGNTPLEALSTLMALATHCMSDKQVCDAANNILEAEKREERKKEAAASKTESHAVPTADASGLADRETDPNALPFEEPYEVATQALSSPKDAPDSKPTAGKIPSLEDIRAKGIETAKKYGQAAVKAILKEFNAENMTALQEDKRAEFLKKLEGLGESNA